MLEHNQHAHRPRHKSQHLFMIGRGINRKMTLILSIGVFITLILGWWLGSSSGLINPFFIPSPAAVWHKLILLWQQGTLLDDLRISIYRIMVAFMISSIMSILVGVLAGCFSIIKAVIEPLVDFVRYMPVVAFVPLTILWFGVEDQQKFIIIWIGTFFQQVLMVIDATKRVPHDFIGLGRTLGMSELQILFKIVLPSALPMIWDALRISLGWAWTWLVVAELVAANSGLGYRILLSQRYFQTDTIIGYILLLGLLGLITDQMMRLGEKILFRYHEKRK